MKGASAEAVRSVLLGTLVVGKLAAVRAWLGLTAVVRAWLGLTASVVLILTGAIKTPIVDVDVVVMLTANYHRQLWHCSIAFF
jgi:hypothetical protein